jgi:hypothetical protein
MGQNCARSPFDKINTWTAAANLLLFARRRGACCVHSERALNMCCQRPIQPINGSDNKQEASRRGQFVINPFYYWRREKVINQINCRQQTSISPWTYVAADIDDSPRAQGPKISYRIIAKSACWREIGNGLCISRIYSIIFHIISFSGNFLATLNMYMVNEFFKKKIFVILGNYPAQFYKED